MRQCSGGCGNVADILRVRPDLIGMWLLGFLDFLFIVLQQNEAAKGGRVLAAARGNLGSKEGPWREGVLGGEHRAVGRQSKAAGRQPTCWVQDGQ